MCQSCREHALRGPRSQGAVRGGGFPGTSGLCHRRCGSHGSVSSPPGEHPASRPLTPPPPVCTPALAASHEWHRSPWGCPCLAPPAEHRVLGPSAACAWTCACISLGHAPSRGRRVVWAPQPSEEPPHWSPPAVPVVPGPSPSSPAHVCPDRARPRAGQVLPHRGFGLHLADGDGVERPRPLGIVRLPQRSVVLSPAPGGGRARRTGFGRGVCRPRGPAWEDGSRGRKLPPACASCHLLGAGVPGARGGAPSVSHTALRVQRREPGHAGGGCCAGWAAFGPGCSRGLMRCHTRPGCGWGNRGPEGLRRPLVLPGRITKEGGWKEPGLRK